jgi:hypothetical protein
LFERAQPLPERRGENHWIDRRSSMTLPTESIQPTQSASSTASSYGTLA